MGKRLYVGNLPFSATDESLMQMFQQAGQVESARIITDRDTGRNKGFGLSRVPWTAVKEKKTFSFTIYKYSQPVLNDGRWSACDEFIHCTTAKNNLRQRD